MSGLQNSDKEKLMSDYLLGELSETGRFQVEERMFADDDYFAELLAAEDSLIEKYLKDELSPEERSGFEKRFPASSKLRERVAVAGKLNHAIKKLPVRSVSASPAEKSSRSRLRSIFDYIFASNTGKKLGFALTALIIVSGVLWLWRQSKLLNDEISRLEQERSVLQQQKEKSGVQTNAAAQQNQRLAAELQTEQKLRAESEEQIIELQRDNERLKELRRESAQTPAQKSNPPQPSASIITFLLTPGLTRDLEAENTLRLSTGVRTVIFNLNLQKNEYQKYQVSLQTPEGREVWRRDDLKIRQTRRGNTLAFPVPARLLPGGVYILTLNGKTAANQTELVNQYAFNVTIK